MKTLTNLITAIFVSFWSLVIYGQNTSDFPSGYIRIGGGAFGPQSREYHGAYCPLTATFLPSATLAIQYRSNKNFVLGLKFSWFNSVHDYSFLKSSFDGFQSTKYCYKEYHNDFSVGPEMRIIMLAKHKFNIQPALFFQFTKQQLTKTMISKQNGPFYPGKERVDHVNQKFILLGCSISFTYALTKSLEIGFSPAILTGGDEFGVKYGSTLDITWKFY